MQRLQHSFTLPHNSCNRWFCWLLSLKAYRGTILVICRDLTGLFLTKSGSCSSVSVAILSGVMNAGDKP